MSTQAKSKKEILITNERAYHGIKGVADLYPERIESGNVVIDPYHYENTPFNQMMNFRQIRDGGRMFHIREGDYVRMLIDGRIMMSDTGMERISNESFIVRAHGRILIAGLGLGMIIRNIIDKSIIERITVIESNPHVIKLVEPRVKHKKLNVIEADIFEYAQHLPKDQKFDTIYFDIWADITQDNLPEMARLHNKYKYHLDRSQPGYFMASWMRDFLRRQRREEQRSAWRW